MDDSLPELLFSLKGIIFKGIKMSLSRARDNNTRIAPFIAYSQEILKWSELKIRN